ncbi:hypothetical protein CBP29_02850 [Fischerella thermalis WC341]|nr:hypothetical protein CBP19_19000 [Fischerella thermalis WC1110]PLZ09604.1 hypothetical protein CBP18_12170 [Fischerella thermalis WC119]PLZ27972.1 hypothetical protein CBP29_02850 [Fischerella thermalis WC341]PLZ38473.1 hypothetical protein CBP26_14715 [Fischerella thermalis WC538]PLZ40682.1 hypothetical protein CBP25_18760 [Fischerella thermalis WC527]
MGSVRSVRSSKQLTANYQCTGAMFLASLPTNYYQLPITNYQLPITNYQLPNMLLLLQIELPVLKNWDNNDVKL